MKPRRLRATITVERDGRTVRLLVAAEMPAVPRSAVDYRNVVAVDLDTGVCWSDGSVGLELTVGECDRAQQALDCALAEQLAGVRALDDVSRRIATTLGMTAAEVKAVRS